jgi:excisionase family DNA binding protein
MDDTNDLAKIIKQRRIMIPLTMRELATALGVSSAHLGHIAEANTLATSRRDEIVRLRDSSLTYTEIGRRFGISRERVRQIIKRKPSPQKPALDSNVLLTITDVAQVLGLHPSTVRRWSNKGILKQYRIGPRGDRRFRRGH